MRKAMKQTTKLVYNPSPKPKAKVVKDETPTNQEALIGLLVGFGYLTIFTVIPYLILINLVPNISDSLAASLSQIVASFIAIGLMYMVSRRVFPLILKNFTLTSFKQAMRYAGIMYLISISYGIISTYVFNNSTVNANQQELIKIAGEYPVVFIFLAVIVAPLIEELIFRYYLYKKLEKRGFLLALTVSTLLFSMIHIVPSFATGTFIADIVTLPAYLLPSLVFAVAYYQTGKLAVPIFAHFAFNLVSAILIFLPINI
jgi:membrane protease YdiL (CAAX protease family)